MDPTTLGIVLGIVSVLLGFVGVVFGLIPLLRRRRVAPNWTSPRWNEGAMKVGTRQLPVLSIRWGVRGINPIHGVKCDVRGPSGQWRSLSSPRGTLTLPKEDLYAYINLVTGEPFNSTISSPADLGKPVQDIVDQAVKGRYNLRIRWYEGDKPKKVKEKVFSYHVA